MNNLLILGCGGHAGVVKEAAISSQIIEKVSYLDDNLNTKSEKNENILGTLDCIYKQEIKREYKNAFVAIGNPKIRIEWISKLLNNGYLVPTIIHPTAWISSSAQIGIGSVILSQSSIQCNVISGIGVIFNNNSSVDHDSKIGDAVHISPGVNIAGNVNIGDRTWVGIGSTIIQNINIGSDVIIGANAAVIKDLPDSIKAVGVPAKAIKTK
tara:strand:- start:1257 stop:1889 length:633 start_codon:yes stop_codon:yes gene_type:complete